MARRGGRRRVERVAEQVVLLPGFGGGVGGVGKIGVDGGGVVGEQLDAVGQQSGVFVGPQLLGFGDVAQVFGGRGQQIARRPAGGGDGGDQ